MSIYTVILFLHIVGAIGYFLGIGIWLFILLGLRRTQRVEQVRSLIHLNDLSAPFSAASAVLLLVTGLYLALTAWSLLTSWILVALISLLLMVPTSAALIAPSSNGWRVKRRVVSSLKPWSNTSTTPSLPRPARRF